MPLDRRRFLTTGAASVAATFAAGSRAGAQALPAPPQGGKALILTGGINRGAYQAGVVIGMAQAAGLKDGEPLDYDLITGSSIGTLNAVLIATAQYTKLREVWEHVGSRNVLRLKKEYRAIPVETSGVLTRVYGAVALALGLAHDVTGVMESEPVEELISDYTDPKAPVHIPMCFTATNISRKRLEVFVRRATTPLGLRKQARFDAGVSPRPGVHTHVVDDSILWRSLFASAALPVVFDPVQIPREDDREKFDQYVDGGLTDNVPCYVAGCVATTLHVVAVDPPAPKDQDLQFHSALGVGTRVFNIMQSEIIRYAAQLTYATNILLAPNVAELQAGGYKVDTLPIQIGLLFPKAELPGKLGDFNDSAANNAMLEIGITDSKRPWTILSNLTNI